MHIPAGAVDRQAKEHSVKPTIALKETLLLENLRNPATRERAFGEVIQQFQQQLYWHIRKMVQTHDDTDDLLQQTFIKAWKNLDNFRGDSMLKTWLYRIATNEALSFIRKEKKRNHTELADIEDDLSHSQSHGGEMGGDEIQRKLMAAVATLPEKQRLVFNMKYFDDLKYQEIQEIVGGSIGSLKASFHHAVKKVEEYLTTH